MGRLIRLELYNFKSYKGHHVLLFGDANFTSIIGPNGSGKSNSMDAISFVLGIKSSHLRSSHLRDLIYRGRILKTSKINADGSAAAPGNDDANGNADDATAAASDNEAADSSSQRNEASTAWVMAVYEDDAGDEQFWKRTITSSGQSDYRINNRKVDAKQYNDVLESENILIKARNFLVFQGDVEAIASQSPKELTRLVEQISGSLEYKAEYDRLQEEAEKANEEQIFKQTQRRGINTEIKTFAEQKKEADNYNDKAQERDEAIVKHVLWKLYHLQQAIDESTSEIQRHQDELKEFRRNMQKYESKLDDAKRDQAKASKDVSKVERHMRSSEKMIEDKMHDLVPVDAKIAAAAQNLEKYNKRTLDVSKERDAQAQVVQELQKNLSTVTKAQSKWEEEFNKQAQKQGKQLSGADLQEHNKLRAQVNQQGSSSQANLDALTRQRKTDEDTLVNLKSSMDEAERQVQKLDSEISEIRTRRQETEAAIKETSSAVEAKKKEISQITSERVKSSQRQTELEEKLQQVAGRLFEATQGRQQSAKEVKAKETVNTLKRMFPGVRGRVHELCKPKQKKYDVAVRTVLGRKFDAIVVDTEKTARACLDYLREHRIGQGTCIPLDTIQPTPIDTKLKGMHKNMRLAIDCIDYDSAFERAMIDACENAMICDDMKTARHLCFDKNVQAKAVTLEGTVIHKAGLMTGGRGADERKDRKWDDTEVDNLTTAKNNILAEIEALPKNHQSTRDIEELRGELVGLEQRLAFSREELKAFEKNEQSKKKQLSFSKSQLKEIKPKYQDQSRKIEELQARTDTLEAEISSIEDKVFAAFCKRLKFDDIRSYEALQGTLQQEGAQKKLEFTKQKTKLENQLSFENTRLQSTNDRLKNLDQQAQRDRDLAQSLDEEKQAMQSELDHIEAEIEDLRTRAEKLKAVHAETGKKVAECRKDVQKRSGDMDFFTQEITRHENEVQRNASQRYALLRKCKIEGAKLPVTANSAKLDSLPVDDMLQDDAGRDPDAMDVDDEDPNASMLQVPNVRDYGIELDFEELDEETQEDGSEDKEKELAAEVASLANDLSKLNPNMRAMERLSNAQNRLKGSESDYRAAQRLARDTNDAFEDVKSRRAELFNKAFTHISEQIKPVYKGLTRSTQYPLGGQAYLDTMSADDETPFLGGLKYHAMPPLKRFRDMDALSGGEKTIAALALLFAIHSYAPSPFFVLDEVDAALDNANVAKVAKYIKEHARPGMQFIVISLKTSLFQESDCLVGVLRDQSANTSKTVTLDLRKYQPT